jgi:hypothetical protein
VINEGLDKSRFVEIEEGVAGGSAAAGGAWAVWSACAASVVAIVVALAAAAPLMTAVFRKSRRSNPRFFMIVSPSRPGCIPASLLG